MAFSGTTVGVDGDEGECLGRPVSRSVTMRTEATSACGGEVVVQVSGGAVGRLANVDV